MTDEQRTILRGAIKEVHDRLHDLYPKNPTAESAGQDIRNQLLVVDLAMHLADEVIKSAAPSEQQVVERTVNLLYGVRLVATSHPLARAAEVLLAESSEPVT